MIKSNINETVFTSNIQKWVSIDNQIKILIEQLKTQREKRAEISDNLFYYVREKRLQQNIIPITDGKLKFIETKIYSPLTFQYVEQSLREIIHNDTQVKQIMHNLKSNRKEKTVPEIKRS
jgi:hypothetical protein